MKYSDEQRIKRIYENAIKLHEYIVTHNINKEDLLADIPLQWLVTTPLYNIGEHVPINIKKCTMKFNGA
ncbi:MAG: hypothetical protein NC337_08850 [Roseburia sp.]|nr:hypothetical protein [Roseburia sp.]